jgi:hypothetical protein
MRLSLDRLADRGCWISDDRIYALVSAAGSIAEVGYHGTQPVSRNSRILVHDEGVLQFSFRESDGSEQRIRFDDVTWTPSGVQSLVLHAGGEIACTIGVSGRALCITFAGTMTREVGLVIRVDRTSLFTQVHGERVWHLPVVSGSHVVLECRDRIMLQSWLDRSGPYAGDFLIPEPVRRKIFAGGKRSGLATRDDLREEFRNVDFPLYDAAVFVRIGGEEYRAVETNESWQFESGLSPGGLSSHRFVIEFADASEQLVRSEARSFTACVSSDDTRGSSPVLSIAGFPHWRSFIPSVPGLVNSCKIRDLGIPRATPGRYYWIWAWDALVSVIEVIRWGDLEVARKTLQFVDAHRDLGGVIPARWTRSLEPLDTPSPGSLEFLLTLLGYELSFEGGEGQFPGSFPLLSGRLRDAAVELRDRGYLSGEGFYPDLLSSFGRNERSAVCMEVGSWYCFCRILQDASHRAGDGETERLAGECAGSIAQNFLRHFWDEEEGFFADAIDTDTGRKSTRHPLFALLFLQSHFGLSLIRPVIDRAADFVERRLLIPHGMRALPLEESIPGGEVVLDAWYPHWDVYALKLLRRAGRGEAILRWLQTCERVLEHLGYCPEFLDLKGFRESRPDAWLRHGAASNLNCVTGWSRAFREGVFGVEVEPGGLTHLPLSLRIGKIGLAGIHWRGGVWDIEVDYAGPYAERLIIDGQVFSGTMKVPIQFGVPGSHRLEVCYGNVRPRLQFCELVNAEIRDVSETQGCVELRVASSGQVDGTLFSVDRPELRLDGSLVPLVWDERTGRAYFAADVRGEHRLKLRAS